MEDAGSEAMRLRVFLSYSRRDAAEVADIKDFLDQNGFETIIDVDDILPEEDWKRRLERLIDTSDVVVFFLSPDSLISEHCGWEVEHAALRGKRLLPVVLRDAAQEYVPSRLQQLNYLFLRGEIERRSNITRLAEALRINVAWLRYQTDLQDRALRWEERGYSLEELLAGTTLTEAAAHLLQLPKDAPRPIDLVREYVRASLDQDEALKRLRIRRQRQLIAGSSTAAVLFAGVAGFAGLQWVDADRARLVADEARLLAENETTRAVRAEELAEQRAAAELAAREAADEALKSATSAANKVVFGLVQKFKDLSVPNSVVESMLKEARDLQNSLAARFPNDFELQASIASALMELGEVYRDQNGLEQSLQAFEEAESIWSTLLAKQPDNSAWIGREAATLRQIGDVHLAAGRDAEARSSFEASVTADRRRLELDPGNLNARRDLAVGLGRLADVDRLSGRLREALAGYTEVTAQFQSLIEQDAPIESLRHDAYIGAGRLATVHIALGDITAAKATLQLMLIDSRAMLAAEPNNTVWLDAVGNSLERVASIERLNGQPEQYEALLREALDLRRKLVRLDPTEMPYRSALASSLEDFGMALRRRGDEARAEPLFEESVVLLRELVASDPSNIDRVHHLAMMIERVGDIRKSRRDLEGALEAYEEQVTLQRDLATRMATDTNAQVALSDALRSVADISLDMGDRDAAMAVYEQSLDVARDAVSAYPDAISAKSNLAWVLSSIGSVHSLAGDHAAALKVQHEALDIVKALLAISPTDFDLRSRLAIQLNVLGGEYLKLGDLEGALAAHEQAIADSRILVDLNPRETLEVANLGMSLTMAGDVLVSLGRPEEAVPYFTESSEIYERLSRLEANTIRRRVDYLTTLFKLGQAGVEPTKNYRLALDGLTELESRGQLLPEESAWIPSVTGNLAHSMGIDGMAHLYDTGDAMAAEAMMREAMALDPNQLWMQVPLASSLLMQDRVVEAEAIYLRHRGQMLMTDLSWEAFALAGLDDLASLGYTHPDMDRIRSLLAAPISDSTGAAADGT